MVTLNRAEMETRSLGQKPEEAKPTFVEPGGKAAALPLRSLLLVQAKLLPEDLLLLLPDWPLAGNCCDGALCSRALSAAQSQPKQRSKPRDSRVPLGGAPHRLLRASGGVRG